MTNGAKNMEQQGKPLVMFGVSLGITAKGVHDFMSAATGVVGFLTACLGFAAGVYALMWWRNRVKKQERDEKSQDKG